MTKGELKEMLSICESAGMADSCQVKVQMLNTSRMDLDGAHFIIEGQDANWSVDGGGHWVPGISEANAIVLKQV